MFTFKLDERSKDPYFSHEEKIFQHQTLTSNTRKYLKTVSPTQIVEPEVTKLSFYWEI